MRSGMVWLLASAAAICTAMACSGEDDEGQVTNTGLPNQPGAGGSAGGGGTASTATAPPAPSSAAGANGESPGVTQQVPGNNNGAAAAGTADAGAGEAEPDAGPAAPAADAGAPPPVNPPVTPPPVTPPPPVNPPPAADVGFSDVFPILVAACGNCHGANAPGARPRFAQAGNEAASLTASLATAPQGGTVADRIIVRGVTQRNMPPACGGAALGTGACLDVAEAALIQAWVDQGSQP